MRTLYYASVTLHVFSALLWVGGMLFLALVVVPALRRDPDRSTVARLLRAAAERYRRWGWVLLPLFLLSGLGQLWARGVPPTRLFSPSFLASDLGRGVAAKLVLFAIVLILSAWHDFHVGPRASRALERDPDSVEARRWRRLASWFGRLNLLLGLALVGLGIALARGC